MAQRNGRGLRRCLGVSLLAVIIAGAVALRPVAAQDSRPPVTFAHDVAPVLYRHCVTCHQPGASAPFSLLTFEDARQRARLIASVVTSHVMPPWQPDQPSGTFIDERRLAPDEIAVFTRWVDDGTLPGSPSDMPARPASVSDWQLGQPDLIVSMSASYTVPADGADVFRIFVLPIPLTERRFVRAMEFHPGNPRVVHHARLLFDDSGDLRRRDLEDADEGFAGMDAPGARFPEGHFLGWAPGKRATREAYPWPLEPGNDLVVQTHLKPTGRPEPVRVSVGLYFGETTSSVTPLLIRMGSKTIDITAGDARYEIVDTFTLPVDVTLVSLSPHAHYLGKTMTVSARRPAGGSTTLLHIPDWNFNWQDDYTFASPVRLPRGSTIEMRYRYDNSDANPRNPSSPASRTRFGPDTRDEMGELLMQVLTSTPDDAVLLRRAIARKTLLTDIAGEEKRIVDVPADVETRNALGVAYVQAGRVAEAVSQFEQALRMRPSYAMTHYNLGVIAMGDGRAPEAIARFSRALELQPEHPDAHNNLGIVFDAQGRADDALSHYRAALRSRPNHLGALNNLGRALLTRGEVEEAIEQFEHALRVRPENPDVRYNLGRAWIASGRPQDAVREWRRAVAARPESLVFTLDLAALLATSDAVKDPGEAMRLADAANRSTGGENPAALDVLAMAYAAGGRLAAAIQTARLALQRAQALHDDGFAAEIQQRVRRWEQTAGERAGGAGNP